MAQQPAFTEAPWPVMRNMVESVLRQHRPTTAYGFTEADVTEPLAAISALQRKAGIALAFNAYAIHCLARAAAEHPVVLTYRRGDRLVTFRDADIATLIEKTFPGNIKLPASHTVRAAQTKSVAAINWELREAIRNDQSHTPAVQARRRLARMPGIVRRYVGWKMSRDPHVLSRYHGTMGLTSLQTPGYPGALSGLPPNICTVTVALGALARRVKLDADGRPVERRILTIAAGMDHLIMDGMAMSRFAKRVVELLESGTGLDEHFVTETRALVARSEA